MHIDRLGFDRVEYEVVLNDEEAKSRPYQFFFVWDSPKLRMLREEFQILFNLCCNGFGSRWPVGCNVRNDFRQVFFGDS